jgi:hypothetical protein
MRRCGHGKSAGVLLSTEADAPTLPRSPKETNAPRTFSCHDFVRIAILPQTAYFENQELNWEECAGGVDVGFRRS